MSCALIASEQKGVVTGGEATARMHRVLSRVRAPQQHLKEACSSMCISATYIGRMKVGHSPWRQGE